MRQLRVLVCDLNDSVEATTVLREILQSHKAPRFEVRCEKLRATPRHELLTGLSRLTAAYDPHVSFLNLADDLAPKFDQVIGAIKTRQPHAPVIAVVNDCEPSRVNELLNQGATDFLVAPVRAIDVLPRLCRLAPHHHEGDESARRLKERLRLNDFVGESPELLAAIKKIPAFAQCDANVFITGETGTGKEICARLTHELSHRVERLFVPVNCGAIPADLVENELFGHASGAFTSATATVGGLIQQAEGGTLFLDEIDSLPLSAQVALLRFLQEREYRPLGSTKTWRADVRVIAASNTSLEDAIRAGRFRQDLFYRLNVLNVTMPPLRARSDDIVLLARHFQARYAAKFNKPCKEFTPSSLQKLALYHWPGNVREIEHVIERAVALSDQTLIESHDLVLDTATPGAPAPTFRAAKVHALNEVEQRYVRAILQQCDGNVSQAAQMAGLDRRGLQRLIRKHQIETASRRSLTDH